MTEQAAGLQILDTVLDNLRTLGPTLRKRAPAAEQAGRHSDETIADLDAAGVFNIASPAEYGGYELSVRQQLDVISEVAKWDGSASWTVWVAASTNWLPARLRSEDHRGSLRTQVGRAESSGLEPLSRVQGTSKARSGRLDRLGRAVDLRQRRAVGSVHEPRLHRRRGRWQLPARRAGAARGFAVSR